MQKIKIKANKLIALFLAISLWSWFFYPAGLRATEYTLDNLDSVEVWQINQDINEKRAAISDLKKQIEVYQKNINAKQKEIDNLASQVSTLNESIAKMNLEIKTAELEIETTNLKIENIELKIQAKEKEIADQKENLAEILRALHREQQKNSLLEILLLNDNFSDFLAELDRLENMQSGLLDGVEQLKTVKMAMADDKKSLEDQKIELDTLKNILDNKKAGLDTQKQTKNYLMKVTAGQEAKFQALLEQAKQEQEQVNQDIVYLEKVAREKANRQLQQEGIKNIQGLIWPVASHTITAYFHDPDYPYRYVFEHPAIDIATPQGTPIKAAESGYVAKVRDGGKTGYSYIMLIHADNLATVYGHVNEISVSNDQFVTKGQIIGYSGGMPGTRGAGPLSTGPHLHLEVRVGGVPVNPLNYLP